MVGLDAQCPGPVQGTVKSSGGRQAGLGSKSAVVMAPVTAKQGATAVAAATPWEKERAPCGARQGLWSKQGCLCILTASVQIITQ